MLKDFLTRIIGFFASKEVAPVRIEVTETEPMYDIKADLIYMLRSTQAIINDVIKSLEGTIPGIGSDVKVSLVDSFYGQHRDGLDLNLFLVDDGCINSSIDNLLEGSRRSRIIITCTYKYYYLHSYDIDMKSGKLTNSLLTTFEIIHDVIMKAIRWEVIAHTIMDLYDINDYIKQYKRDDNNFKVPEFMYLSFSVNHFLNFKHMTVIHGTSDMMISSDFSKITLIVSIDDAIEAIRNSITSIKDYIVKLFEAEKIFIRENLQSIILVRLKKGDKLIIHTSILDSVIINDEKIEYTDLFTGLRNTIIIRDNVTNISEDNLKPKHTTMLPKAHQNLFNQNALQLL